MEDSRTDITGQGEREPVGYNTAHDMFRSVASISLHGRHLRCFISFGRFCTVIQLLIELNFNTVAENSEEYF